MARKRWLTYVAPVAGFVLWVSAELDEVGRELRKASYRRKMVKERGEIESSCTFLR
jgi:hypothetical protein